MIDFVALCERMQNEKLGELGKTIMIDTLPISVSKGICVRSDISGDEIDYELPGFARGTFRLIVRSAKYKEGEELLHKAIKALFIERPTRIGKMNVRYCKPRTTPMCFPISQGNLREFAVNMMICYDFDTTDCPWISNGKVTG